MAHHRLKNRTDLHLARKAWHIAGVLFIVIVFNQVSRLVALQLITFATFLFVGGDLLRLQVPRINHVFIKVFHPIMRNTERHGFAGTSALLMGTMIVMFVFPREVVSLALLFLAIGDPLASYVGIRYGRDQIIGRKSLQGTAAAFFTCSAVAAAFYLTQNIMIDRLLIVSLLSGATGALAELIPLGRMDDNFTFPLLSCTGLWIIFYLFGGFY